MTRFQGQTRTNRTPDSYGRSTVRCRSIGHAHLLVAVPPGPTGPCPGPRRPTPRIDDGRPLPLRPTSQGFGAGVGLSQRAARGLHACPGMTGVTGHLHIERLGQDPMGGSPHPPQDRERRGGLQTRGLRVWRAPRQLYSSSDKLVPTGASSWIRTGSLVRALRARDGSAGGIRADDEKPLAHEKGVRFAYRGPWVSIRSPTQNQGGEMATLLWILAVILVIGGIVALVRREFLWGAVLIIVGLLVGPGGVSVFT